MIFFLLNTKEEILKNVSKTAQVAYIRASSGPTMAHMA